MKTTSRQAGFSLVEAVVFLFAAALIGCAGWLVYGYSQKKGGLSTSDAKEKQGRKTIYVNASQSIGSSCFYYLLNPDGSRSDTDICVKNEDVEKVRINLETYKKTSTTAYFEIDADVHYGTEEYHAMDQKSTPFKRTTLYIDYVYSTKAHAGTLD